MDYVQDIINSISDIASFIEGMTVEDFTTDRKTINAVIRSIEVIGEAAKNIPPSVRDKHPSVPWKKMTGIRNKMIHEYFGVDLGILWKTAQEDIPELKTCIERLVESFDE